MTLPQWGVCTNFLGKDAYSLHTEDFPLLSRHFPYIELPAMTVADLSREDFALLTRAAEACSARFRVMTNLFPARFQLLSPHLDRGELSAYLEGLLPRCRALGCDTLVLGSGKSRCLQSGQSQEEGYAALAGLLNQTVLPLCRRFGVRLTSEALNPGLTDFILDLWEGRELALRCEDEVGLLADSLHLMDHPQLERELEENSPWITHVHLSGTGRAAPCFPLSPQLGRFLSGLKAIGYQGLASFECRMEQTGDMEAAKAAVIDHWNFGSQEVP